MPELALHDEASALQRDLLDYARVALVDDRNLALYHFYIRLAKAALDAVEE